MNANLLDVAQLPLGGRHLIEASAGTGKTFNITRIYLRCLLEKDLQVQQILVMTFTKAATEEIRGRIASTLRQALKYWQQRSIDQPFTKDPVFDVLYQRVDPQQAIAHLHAALLELDEAAVFTIHSFCNKVLADMAFNSSVPLELNLATDVNRVYLDGCEDFIRNVSQDEEAFTLLAANNWHTPLRFYKAFSDLLTCSDAPRVASAEIIESEFSDAAQRIAQGYTQRAHELLDELLQQQSLIVNSVVVGKPQREDEWREIVNWLESGPLYCVPKSVGDFVNGNRFRAKKAGVPEAKMALEPLKQFRVSLNDSLKTLHKKKLIIQAKAPAYSVVHRGVEFIRDFVQQQKSRLYSVDFDDLIRLLAEQIDGSDSPLSQLLRQRYPVALVDEFQDTDASQYHILKNVYPPVNNGEKASALEQQDVATLMMIGDPKQAIYGFRGGDIFTYLNAAKNADYHWIMNTNWRSTQQVVDGYNRLFLGGNTPDPQRDLFQFGIRYEAVKATTHAEAAGVPIDDPCQSRAAITFLIGEQATEEVVNKSISRQRLVLLLRNEILRLLSQVNLGDRLMEPGDIAVLVKNGREAKLVHQALKDVEIASVYLSNRNSLYATAEATDLLMVLKAVWQPHNQVRINSILASPLLGLSHAAIQSLLIDDNSEAWDELLIQLAFWRQLWECFGILSMLLTMLQNNFVPQPKTAERQTTNYLHLAEVLQDLSRSYANPEYLLHWLHRQVLEPDLAPEQVQRLESDAHLIQIVTQHGSKGLEYPIVFVPFATEYRDPLKFGGSHSEVLRYYDEQTAQQKMALGATPSIQQRVSQESDAESMRLLYVAITRASHRCYLGVVDSDNCERSALGHILQREHHNSWQDAIEQLISEGGEHTQYTSQIVQVPLAAQNAKGEELAPQQFTRTFGNSWKLTSFSALVRQRTHTSYRQRETEMATVANALAAGQVANPVTSTTTAYRFVIKAGANTGNLLHDILEVVDFTSPNWGDLGRPIALRYGVVEDDLEALFHWLAEVFNTPISLGDFGSVCLNQLPVSDTLREAEFYFPIHTVSLRELEAVLREHREQLSKVAQHLTMQNVDLSNAGIDGMMHGFIDLIFTHQGRYFVADYKSTLLGSDVSNYGWEALAANNQQHYYDLQYLIYSVALHRFLTQRIANYDPQAHFGGVAYLYLRGMSSNFPRQSGVFYHPLSIELLRAAEKALTGCQIEENLNV